MKLPISAQFCVKVMIFWVTVLELLNMCVAAPLDSYYPTDDSDEVAMLTNPQVRSVFNPLTDYKILDWSK